MKTTIIGGVLFLAPLAIIALLLGKVFQISMLVAQPIDRVIPIESFSGIAFVNILAIVIIICVCYGAGLLARGRLLGSRLQHIDGMFTDAIPGYAVFKGTVSSVKQDEAGREMLRPVLVRFDDYEQIAFEVDQGAQQSVVFLPGSPAVWSGTTIIVDRTRISAIDQPTFNVMRQLRVLGRGTLVLREAAVSSPLQPLQEGGGPG
ncbi:MAG: hypothetical protein AAF636_07035 [Pseudomonadota bacterium]